MAVAQMHIIHRLDESTINRIAAGEIIQRPAGVVKELLENSLDAGAKSVTITTKGGGMDMLQIQDTGHGIRKESLDIVCERFTTSKISRFEDLETVGTFGFRGEALASISHVAHVTITTKTEDQPCAYKAKYSDGKLMPLKPGDKATPKPCAGVNGTTICVEDLFYNMATRRQAFKSHKDEYQRVLEVVSKYAVHFGDKKISFSCKRTDAASADLHTPATSCTLDNIKLAYGAALSRELITFECHSVDMIPEECKTVDRYEMPSTGQPMTISEHDGQEEAPLRFLADGYISNANYSSKKSICVIFINNRLVECASVRKTIESVYARYLPKHTHPFIYLSLRMPPQHVDVNVHPTKKEVHFLHEDALLGQLYDQTMAVLSGANESRVFYAQSVLSAPSISSVGTRSSVSLGVRAEAMECASSSDLADSNSPTQSRPPMTQRISSPSSVIASKARNRGGGGGVSTRPYCAANKLVRTDHTSSRINEYFRTLPTGPTHDKALSSQRRGESNAESQRDSESEDGETGNDFSRKGESCPCCATEDIRPSVGMAQQFCSLCTSQDTSLEKDSASAAPGRSIPTVITSDSKRKVGAITKRMGSDTVSDDEPSRTGRQSKLRRPSEESPGADDVMQVGRGSEGALLHHRRALPAIARTACEYASIRTLVSQIDSACSLGVKAILKKHTMVGLVNYKYMLVQHETRLVLLDHSMLALHLFYQLAVTRFGEMKAVQLASPVPVQEFVKCALESPAAQWSPEDGSKEEISAAVSNILLSKSPMLQKYFGIEFINTETDGGAHLVSVPELLDGYSPLPERLPLFLLRLAIETDWENEMNCFANVATELALYYSELPKENAASHSGCATVGMCSSAKRVLLSQLIPAMQAYLLPCKEFMSDGTVVQVAALEQLYKVFERC